MNLIDILQMSNDEAREFLEGIRWPNGPACPHCGGSEKLYELKGKSHRKGLRKCGDCRKQFTVTVGTIFERSHIHLNKWIGAIYLMCSSKKGISAHQLHRMLGMTYKSAWFMAHRVRYAMERPPLSDKLQGIIEADETYVGAKKVKGKRGRGADKKIKVFSLIQRDGDSRSFVVPNVKGQTLKKLIQENVEGEAHLMTDEFRSYRGLDKIVRKHETVTHSKKEIRTRYHTYELCRVILFVAQAWRCGHVPPY